MRTVLRYALLLTALACLRTLDARGQEAEPQDEAPTRESTASKADEEPEAAFRAFLIAMIDKDEEQLKAVTLPTDPDDLKVLLAGEDLPEENRKQARYMIAHCKLKRLSVGDKIKLPNRTYVLSERDVAEDRVALQLPVDPLFTRVRKVDDQWLVDPSAMIAARKAAHESRKRAEQAKQEQAEEPSESSTPEQP